MEVLKKIKRVLDLVLETLVAASMAALVLVVVWQVFTRFVMNSPSNWTSELAIFLLVWVGLLGASVALNRGAHLGIDYFVMKLPPTRRIYTEIFSFGVVALFSLLVLTIGGVQLVLQNLELGQESAALELKMGYVYLALPISGFFLTLYSGEFLLERIVALAKGQLEEEVSEEGRSKSFE